MAACDLEMTVRATGVDLAFDCAGGAAGVRCDLRVLRATEDAARRGGMVPTLADLGDPEGRTKGSEGLAAAKRL